MGYYSDFNGDYTSVKPLTRNQKNTIKQWFITRFGWYHCNGGVDFKLWRAKDDGTNEYYTGDIIFDDEDGVVVPVDSNMKGYDFNEHLYEFVQFLKKEMPDVQFIGEVERSGEEWGDMECIKIKDGKVLSYQGHIDWDSPDEVRMTEAQKKEAFKKEMEERYSVK